MKKSEIRSRVPAATCREELSREGEDSPHQPLQEDIELYLSRIMENCVYGRELNAPPKYESRNYEPLKEEVEFRNSPGQAVQSTVVTIMSDSPPVRDHIIWSFFNTIYLNFCCLGLLAFVFSVKSRDRKLHGDRHGALSYASTARSLNIAATVLSILSLVILIIIFITQMVTLAHSIQQSEADFNRYGK